MLYTFLFFVCVFFSFTSANNINAGGQKGLIRTMTTETHGLGATTMGVAGKFDFDRDYALGPGGSGHVMGSTQLAANEYSQLYSGDAYLVYGVHRAWDFALDLPFYHDKPGFNAEDHTGIGNLELSSKLAYPFNQDELFITQAYFFKMVLPTGDAGSGYFPRHAYYIKDNPDPQKDQYTSDNFVLVPMILWSMHFNRLSDRLAFKLHANLGGAINSNSAVLGALGVEYNPIEQISLFLEISGESRVKHYVNKFDYKSFDNDIFLLTPGLKLTADNGMHFSFAVDLGIADRDERSEWLERGYEYSTEGSPVFGLQFSLGWTGFRKNYDSDGDGIKNKKDQCPQQPEDKDGHLDDDGCPDLDNDHDGVLDSHDQCPNTFTEVIGCPEVDVDGDGIRNLNDECPEDPEDKDGYNDHDGCPDLDNDRDAILDADDKCPDKPEDKDGYQDDDGCPDLDNDDDGVYDTEDKCPDNKGSKSASGCPLAKEIPRGTPVLLNVSFASGKAKLSSNSYTILDQVVASLNEWVNTTIEIQGHTDNRGSKADNKKLSQKRARAVMQYLMDKGIAPERLKAVGYGPDKPLASNKRAAGRERNRRVEMVRTD